MLKFVRNQASVSETKVLYFCTSKDRKEYVMAAIFKKIKSVSKM